ncbi:MAG TPA: succinate dehydrogenase cytochrome b subunit [Thermoanaerobaculia bacterium]|nr:succinate dehydrogenase cytochrome b subunit [Thermoanaerobaculia bacterium]
MSAIPSTAERPVFGSITLKAVMALTGIVLYGFVFVHMVGNIQLYQGPEKINGYAAFLKAVPPLLWGTRITLLAAVVLHGLAAFTLWRRNLAARPVGYAHQDFQAAGVTSRTMYWTGPVIALFVIYHLLHFTLGSAHPQFSHTDVYTNVVVGFSNVWVSGFYVLAMVALGFHLFHGGFSLFQTLGLRTPKYEKPIKAVLAVLCTVIVVVNVSFPIAVLAGLVK